jgi:hypothetical protein
MIFRSYVGYVGLGEASLTNIPLTFQHGYVDIDQWDTNIS